MTAVSQSIEASVRVLVRKLTQDLINAALTASLADLGSLPSPRPAITYAPRAPLPKPARAPRRQTSAAPSRVHPTPSTPEPVEPDSGGHMITNPGLLLEASFAAPPEPPTRPPQGAPRILEPPAPAAARLPVPPGEELQRTTGGSMVLRRRAQGA